VVTKFINLNLCVVWAVCCAFLMTLSHPSFLWRWCHPIDWLIDWLIEWVSEWVGEWVWSTEGMILTGNQCPKRDLSPFVHHKFHMHWPGVKPGLLWWEDSELPEQGRHLYVETTYVRSGGLFCFMHFYV
jgi:hypothetical protein